jgi:hypothetical protein
MSLYSNLPPDQRRVQRLVDQFNAEEELWRAFAVKRCLRRRVNNFAKPGTGEEVSRAENKRLKAGTRIFSPVTVPGLCDAIGRYWYLFQRNCPEPPTLGGRAPPG